MSYLIIFDQMEDLPIHIIITREQVKDVFYRDGRQNVLTYEPTRTALIGLIVTIVITAGIYFISFRFPGISWLLLFGFMAIVVVALIYLFVVSKYLKWKDGVKFHMARFDKINLYNAVFTNNEIKIITDLKMGVEPWEAVASATINEYCIILCDKNGAGFVIPAKSTKLEDFDRLKLLVREKVNKINQP